MKTDPAGLRPCPLLASRSWRIVNSTTSDGDRPTIVFVHGAWADASGFDGSIRALHSQGYRAIGAANPLRGLGSDGAYLDALLQTVEGQRSSSPTPTAARSSPTPRPATTRSRRWCSWPGGLLMRERASSSSLG
jgi:hypothetical protein